MPAGDHGVDDLDAVGSHCPRCNAEYRAGFTHCADCGVELVPGPAPAAKDAEDAWAAANTRVWGPDGPAERPHPDDHEPPIPIASLPWRDAWLLRGTLQSAGIEAFLYPPDPPSAIGLGFFGHADVIRRYEVLVYRSNVDEARAIAAEVLAALDDQAGEGEGSEHEDESEGEQEERQ